MNSIESTNKDYWTKIRHPYSCGIELTPYCNMNCVHCYMQGYKVDNILRFNEIKKILDILFDEGLLFVYFTGGEILTHPDFLEIFLYAKKKGFIVELLSNITLLTTEVVSVFSEYPPATISISIYGASEETYCKVTGTQGNYFRAINALEMLQAAHLNFEIKFIGLKQNIKDFFAVEAIAKRLGVKFTHTFEMFPTLSQDNSPINSMLSIDEILDFEQNYEASSKRWATQCVPSKPVHDAPLYFCDIATSNFIIDCEGYMNPCNKLRTQKYKILETPFKEIWAAFAKYKQIKAPPDYPCPMCAYRAICVPCPAENYLSTNNCSTPSRQVCLLSQRRMEVFSGDIYSHYRK